MTETTFIFALLSGILLFTLIIVSILLYIALRRQRQLNGSLEKHNRDLTRTLQLTQMKLEVQEYTLSNMSAEMHENIAQILVSVKLRVQMLVHGHPPDDKRLDEVKEISQVMNDVIKDLREMSYAMKDIYLLRKGLNQSVEKELGRIQVAHRIKCNFTQTGMEQRLDEEKELILFSIIQESVAHIVSDSMSMALSVSLHYGADWLEVLIKGRVSDSVAAYGKRGSGAETRKIEERLQLLDGVLNIASDTQKGTRIQLTIPV